MINPDIIRVLRIVEYVGERSLVEAQIAKSVHGTRPGTIGVLITAQTIGEFPEVLEYNQKLTVALSTIADLRAQLDEVEAANRYNAQQSMGLMGTRIDKGEDKS